MDSGRLVFRNFLTLGTGEVIARWMHVLAVILLGRALKPEMFGQFELALAITSYALLGIRQGFDLIAIREVARNLSRESEWLRAIVRLRLFLALGAGTAVFAWVSIRGWQHPLSVLLVLFAASYLANAITPQWRFLALQQPKPPAIASVVSQIIFLGTVVLLVRSPSDAWKAAAGWVVGELGAAAILWMMRRPGPEPGDQTPVSAGFLFRESLPVTASLVLGQLMYNFDLLALAAMGKGSEIGFYLASYRCATGFAPLLGHLQNSILPRFASDQADPEKQLKLAWKMAATTALVGLGIAAAITAGASQLMDLFFGSEYRGAVPLLRILVWLLPLQFARAVLRQVLLAGDRQLSDTRNVGLAALTNIGMDLALVPSFGAMGCAISTLGSEFVFLAGTWHALRSRGAARRS